MSERNSINSISDTEINRVAVKLFLRISDEWELTAEQSCLLAGVESAEILEGWNRQVDKNEPVTITPSTLQRLSLIAGIYKSVQGIFSGAEQWRGWVHKPNSQFQGKSALEWMLQGDVAGMTDVRRYLETQYSGAYY
ncbi:MAG: MbcA/ParS/Xre antitoxin family protein [Pseudomonadales bacterium]|nr:MbcA/ParS/Xre antitoxin family protein [Pseudomonadales bacterium]